MRIKSYFSENELLFYLVIFLFTVLILTLVMFYYYDFDKISDENLALSPKLMASPYYMSPPEEVSESGTLAIEVENNGIG